MKFRIEINQKEIIEAGIKGLKIQEWLLFDVVRHMIGADWTKKITVNEKSYAWISEQAILEQIPLLEVSTRQVHRLVDNIIQAGLLVRYDKNQGEKKVYLGLTPLGDSIGRHSLTNLSDSDNRVRQKRQAESDISGKLSLTEMSEDNTSNYNPIKDNSLPPDSQANRAQPPKVKKRITYHQAIEFYEKEFHSFGLEDLSPLPQNVAARRAALQESYRRCFTWMRDGDDENPGGLRSEVMTMGLQLSFKQFQLLVDERKLSGYQIKSYLIRIENYTDNKNKSIYHTICKWHDMDKERGSVPPREPVKNSGGLSTPNKVTQ